MKYKNLGSIIYKSRHLSRYVSRSLMCRMEILHGVRASYHVGSHHTTLKAKGRYPARGQLYSLITKEKVHIVVNYPTRSRTGVKHLTRDHLLRTDVKEHVARINSMTREDGC